MEKGSDIGSDSAISGFEPLRITNEVTIDKNPSLLYNKKTINKTMSKMNNPIFT